jgi:uncharacterized membrane protein YfcA
MDLLAAVSSLSVLSGFVVGMLVGLTGVGGGSLMTPLLILVFGASATTAVGTDLLYAAATKSVGILAHSRKRNIDWQIVARLAAGSLPASLMTIALLDRIGVRGGTSPRFVTIILGLALVVTAAAVMAGRQLRGWRARHGLPGPPWAPRLTIIAGFVLGVLVTISSVGAGALGMTMLIVLYPRAPLVRLVGSDIAHAVPLTLVAGLGHWLLGSVDWTLMISLLVGSVPGIILGSNLSSRLPERVLRPILAAVLLLVGIRMLIH